MPGDLHKGDNLEVLRTRVADACVDLVYLDPPFNSRRRFEAFDDRWRWTARSERAYAELEHQDGLAPTLALLRGSLGPGPGLAYLAMLGARLLELRRVMNRTGLLFVHLDPTASHYVKLVLDALFGAERFHNEIVWQRSTGKGLSTRRLPRNHDVILVYRKGDRWTWNADEAFTPYDPARLDERTQSQYAYEDERGRYTLGDLVNPNPDRPNLTYEFLGVRRVWRWTKERMERALSEGLVVQSRPGAVPRLKRYLNGQRGKPMGDVWTDIAPLSAHAGERLGYPTQKPLALLERIVRIASNPGDVVLDPFCGSGTTLEACEKLGRRWIGIDEAARAIATARRRLAAIRGSPTP